MTGIHSAASRRQAEASVDAMIAAQTGNTDEPGQAPASDPAPAESPDNALATPDAPPQATPAAGEVPTDTPSPGETPPGEPVDWKARAEASEARFAVLKGKYDTEVPALHAEVKELKKQLAHGAPSAELESLRAEVAALRAGQTTAETPSPDTPPPASAPDLQSLRDQYGDDWVDGLIGVVRSELSTVQERMANQQPQGLSFSDKLDVSLSSAGIDLQTMNRDKGFLYWLAQYDSPESLNTRQELLNAAVNDGNVNAAADFFRRYVSLGSGSPAGAPNPMQEHAQVPDGGAGDSPPAQQVSLEQAFQEYIAGSDAYTRGKISAAELEELERRYYALQAPQQ